MSRAHTAFRIGYHGCDEDVGKRAIAGEIKLLASDKSYDWLGPGIYFWESDFQRAFEWARRRTAGGTGARPFVVGAVIDMGNCLDLTLRENHEILRIAYGALQQRFAKAGHSLPENRGVKSGTNKDKPRRFLDCAVIRVVHASVDGTPNAFDTVRGLFVEGAALYPGSGFNDRSHTQIAVVNEANIVGLFLPREIIECTAGGL